MRSTTALLHLAMCLSSFSTVTSAWPGWLPEIDALVVRANDDPSTTTTQTADSTITNAPKSTATDKESGNETKNLNTASAETTGKKGDSKTTKDDKTTKATHTTFAANDPPGGVSMVTPATTAIGTALYKISNNVTWGWNYTSLLGKPTAVDVLVSCSVASQTWTLTSNMTFETSVHYVWDTNKNNGPEQPLLTEMYTLIVKDSDASVTEIPEPGYLGVYSGFQFGLYTKQPYVSYDEWECTGCNSAPGLDHHAISLAVTMSLVTLFSFTWFVTGLGLH